MSSRKVTLSELPDINEEEAELYDEIPSLKGMNVKQLNKLLPTIALHYIKRVSNPW